MPKLSDVLADRLAGVESPDWYLTLFGRAVEETGDLTRAVAVADAMIAEEPFAPPSDEDRLAQLVADDAAEDTFFAAAVETPEPKEGSKSLVPPSPFLNRH